MFVAAFMMCLIGREPTFETCSVFQSPEVYRTEEECKLAIIENIGITMDLFINSSDYEVISYRCTDMIPNWVGV